MMYVKKIESGQIVWSQSPKKGDTCVVVKDEAGKREISQSFEHDGANFSDIIADAAENAKFSPYAESKTTKSRFA